MVTYTLKVVEIRKETEDTVTLCFKQPALRKIKYYPGQYLTLIFRINGRRYVRPYSFSSAPTVDPLIEVTIKRVQNGMVSNHIHDQVKTGDVIEVMEPIGDFIFDGTKGVRTVYFYGVGSGITPLISMIKSILNTDPLTKVHLVYGNRNPDTTIFSGLISSLLTQYPGNFSVDYLYTQFVLSENIPGVVEGRINKDYALDILSRTDLSDTNHYICGPVGLKESVKEALNILNVPAENIFSEDFELIKDPADFIDIYTRPVTLKFQNSVYTLEVIKGKSILETALDTGLELPYSCQTGSCSTCKATCTNGEVKMIGLTKERKDLEINEYLLCCSHPLSEDVCIEI